LATSSSIVSVVLMHQYIIYLMRWCQNNISQDFLFSKKKDIKLSPDILYRKSAKEYRRSSQVLKNLWITPPWAKA
jgi:hypothetical protein